MSKELSPREFDLDGERVEAPFRKPWPIYERKTYSGDEGYFGRGNLRVIDKSYFDVLLVENDQLKKKCFEMAKKIIRLESKIQDNAQSEEMK